MDKITLGAAGKSCKEVCAPQGGCNPKLEELIFATGDAVKTMKAIAKSQGRTCSADHQNGHWLSPYINKGSSTQCNVGDGTNASDCATISSELKLCVHVISLLNQQITSERCG